MKHSLYNKGKRDANEPEIIALLNARNVRYLMLRPGDGADLLVCVHPAEFWEVKSPAQPESKRRLTDDERELLAYCAATHIPYVVIETVDDAARRLNQYFGRL